MRENFNIALGFVLREEGGYVNDPDDPGGETNMGISKRYHPDEDIKNMTANRAGEIYLAEYWLPQCDTLSFPFDIVYFDTNVNMGKDDANDCLAESPEWEIMLFRRIMAYCQKVIAKPRKIKFFFGWMQRCMNLHKLVKSEIKRRKTGG